MKRFHYFVTYFNAIWVICGEITYTSNIFEIDPLTSSLPAVFISSGGSDCHRVQHADPRFKSITRKVCLEIWLMEDLRSAK